MGRVKCQQKSSPDGTRRGSKSPTSSALRSCKHATGGMSRRLVVVTMREIESLLGAKAELGELVTRLWAEPYRSFFHVFMTKLRYPAHTLPCPSPLYATLSPPLHRLSASAQFSAENNSFDATSSRLSTKGYRAILFRSPDKPKQHLLSSWAAATEKVSCGPGPWIPVFLASR